MIDPALELAVSDQCRLLGLSRSTYYYERGVEESDENLALMEQIDRLYLAHPENGSRMMVKGLKRRGVVNRERVQRLMQLMGIRSLCPQPKTTTPNKAHPVYPYLLRNMVIDHPNQVWAADITYVPFRKGSWYLVAIMDWHSRKVLTWRLSNTMTADFCVAALHEALALYGAPYIFNTDQGSSVHVGRLHQGLEGGRDGDLDGRRGSSDRQRVRRTPLAHAQIRPHLSEPRRERHCLSRRHRHVLALLQRRASAQFVGRLHARRGLL
jgi:putative transposase